MPTEKPLSCQICEDGVVSRYKKLRICDCCYSGLQYWKGKSVGDVIKRDAQLRRLRRRSAFMMGARTNQVVEPYDRQVGES